MAKGKTHKLVYGMYWNVVTPQLAIEMEMCRKGGTVKLKDGSVVGNGVLWHWLAAKKIIWPEYVHHRWNELETKCYIENKYIAELGSAAGGKTHTGASNVLLDWYLYPHCTTVLVSSTDLKSLDLRAWGAIKSLHKSAKERFPYLVPGHLIEGARMIINDARDQSEQGRTFKNGLVAVPCKHGTTFVGLGCFLDGTSVDTPVGPRPIESIHEGDLVLNALGSSRVRRCSIRFAKELVRVWLNNGHHIDCTPEHPFLTTDGWTKAIDLTSESDLVSTDEAMSCLRKAPSKAQWAEKILLTTMSNEYLGETLLPMWEAVYPERGQSDLLQSILRSEVEMGAALYRQEIPNGPRTNRLVGCGPEGQRLEKVSSRMEVQVDSGQSFSERKSAVGDREEIVDRTSPERTESVWRSRQWSTAHLARVEIINRFSGSPFERADQGSHSPSWQRGLAFYEAGSGMAKSQTGCGSGWRNPHSGEAEKQGCKERRSTERVRVDRVEILQRRSGQSVSESGKHYRVYNLEVEGHPSYSVMGLLVHNSYIGIHNKRVRLLGDELGIMPRAMLDATSNLSKCEDFKMLGLGNPNDPTDALGDLAEPHSSLGGWDSGLDQSDKTKTWKTKWPNGIAIQLPGTDSPNFDVPEDRPPPFPFLITRQQMADDASHWGVGDWHYTSMNLGRMPRGIGTNRVLTRQMCEKFHAFDEPIWRDTNIKKIAFLDAAYSVGGDRCIFGEMNFGRSAEMLVNEIATTALSSQTLPEYTSRQIIHLVDTAVVPITDDKGSDLPEDQIVHYVVNQCERRGISLDDFFYDPGMRTKLTVAFSRITGRTGNPIDCGGKATERPVAAGVDVLCVDYYSKFVTELWYSVRLCVEANQFRGMTKGAMWEFAAREWIKVGGNKIEVESKADMKKKTGRSPDEADSVAIGLEGARQRGFVIVKAGAMNRPRGQIGDRWKRELRDSSARAWRSRDLDYSV